MFPSAISLFFLLVFHLSTLAEAQPVQLYYKCDTSSNFTANSTYQSNLNRLLTSIPSNGSASGFLKDSQGQHPHQVSGLVLCRGDINATACRSCLDTAAVSIRQLCAYRKAAAVWYDVCFLRFSNQRSILSDTDFSFKLFMKNQNNVTQLDRFDHLLGLLLNTTADLTVNSSRRFATAKVSKYTSEFPTIYGLMQCVPDLSMVQCGRCLRGMFEPQSDRLKGARGGRAFGFSCDMRYEVYSFYQGTPTQNITARPAPAPRPLPSPSPAITPPTPPPPPAPLPSRSPHAASPATTIALTTAIAYVIAIVMTACC